MAPALWRRAVRARRDGVRIRGFAAIGEGVCIQPGAMIEDSVIWDGARIGERAELRKAIVGRGACVAGAAAGAVLSAGTYSRTALFRSVLEALNFAPARTVVLPFAPRGSARALF